MFSPSDISWQASKLVSNTSHTCAQTIPETSQTYDVSKNDPPEAFDSVFQDLSHDHDVVVDFTPLGQGFGYFWLQPRILHATLYVLTAG